jgi:hypothetical protein
LRMGGRSHTSAAPRRDCCTFWPQLIGWVGFSESTF